MADEIHDQPLQLMEDANEEVAGNREHAQHLMEVDEDSIEEDDFDEGDEFDEEEDEDEDEEDDEGEDEDEGEEEDEDEEEEVPIINEDPENRDDTAVCSAGEEKEGGGGFNRDEIDGLFCPICMEAWTNGGDHRVCCLPCGHIYGQSCINKWIQRRRSSRKCPQCNQKCTLKDVRVLYASRVVAADEELRKKVLSLEAKFDSLKNLKDKHLSELIEQQTNEAEVSVRLREIVKRLKRMDAKLVRMDEKLDFLALHLRVAGYTARFPTSLQSPPESSTDPPT